MEIYSITLTYLIILNILRVDAKITYSVIALAVNVGEIIIQ